MRPLLLPEVRALAAERNIVVMRAVMNGCSKLFAEAGAKLCAAHRGCAFNLAEARRLLLGMPMPQPAKVRKRVQAA
jgi:hypothetical protein